MNAKKSISTFERVRKSSNKQSKNRIFPKILQRNECKHIAANISLELEQGKLPRGRFRAQEQPQILVH